ncbi:DUF3906 family protein [Cohnella sp. CFH 77786]|uniref:DUF3906 family protein n=1 Tax=Cohnella sp. CFH 77786 TaxID=2662265 RepID=UPI001C60A07E|nr:DUF3906 family protein [Cohnella sp. CFH 77786]MBW5445072.1 DUF3906 family protein [Cohnella sp. CFH 77786]
MAEGMPLYLYKLEAQMPDRQAVLVILAETDLEAMEEAEVHLSKHFIGAPEIKEIVLIEKRRANKGAGYVIET